MNGFLQKYKLIQPNGRNVDFETKKLRDTGEMSIPPYQFEPRRLAGQAATPQSVASTSGNSGGTGGTPGGAPSDRRMFDNSWCRCGNCVIMPTVTECICCAEVPNVVAMNGGGDAGSNQCIVDHGHFAEVCLLPHVLGSVIVLLQDVTAGRLEHPISNRYVA